ncbi:uncharacterized protein LOC106636749 isoform X2 [Copidosoma floridanum]|uniref:uncharacterized protein LOC106636749 isoform X2 n=1 Tax=Copidosoma floridanum TaxID=29053 RepID=UPI000C6F8164|nr:uncharacterized protein LOC106636749 isoform X2 [Copidosoma floridanum]
MDISKQYAISSTEWITALAEKLDFPPLSDVLLCKLGEDISYRLREILHKCALRLRHSKRRYLKSVDINAVFRNLCDVNLSLGASESLPDYFPEVHFFPAQNHMVDILKKVYNPPCLPQLTAPLFQAEVLDTRFLEETSNYIEKVLKTIFNGSQKTFEVLLSNYSTNNFLTKGVVDKLMLIARSMLISHNAQYTKVSMRTCQLIMALTNDSKAVYPHQLDSVEKLTELLLELLLGQGFINPRLECLFKNCVLKLMLRWPVITYKFIVMLKKVLIINDERRLTNEKKAIALEILISVEPLIFFNESIASPLHLTSILIYATPSSCIWHRIALMINALLKSGKHQLSYSIISQHFGDSIIPYLTVNSELNQKSNKLRFPMIYKSKIKYIRLRNNFSSTFTRSQKIFSDLILKEPRREIKFAFSGGRLISSNNLRRDNLRANYQILRNDCPASYALIALNRLTIPKFKRKFFFDSYNLSSIIF